MQNGKNIDGIIITEQFRSACSDSGVLMMCKQVNGYWYIASLQTKGDWIRLGEALETMFFYDDEYDFIIKMLKNQYQ